MTTFNFSSIISFRIKVEPSDIQIINGEEYVKLSSLAGNPEVLSKFTTVPKEQKRFNVRSKGKQTGTDLETEELEVLEY